MARVPTEWAFDVQEHIIDHYGDRIDFTPDDHQNYPDRVVGTVTEPTMAGKEFRAVIIPKPVGHDNAVRYRRWVTLPPIHWQNLTARPGDWRYFVLMIGLLPDGQPWWSALYEEGTLAQLRDHSENMGGWYRFDPGLAQQALIADWDKDRPDAYVDSPASYLFATSERTIGTADQAEFMGYVWDHAATQPDGEVTGRIDVQGTRMSIHIE